MENIDRLAEEAGNLLMVGAAEYLKSRNRTDTDTLAQVVAAIRACAREAFDEAVKDANEAIGAGMTGYAVPTFRATLKLAGINAAKSVIGA